MLKKAAVVLGILLVLFVSDALVPWSGLVVRLTGDALTWKTAFLAGWRGIDCGRVRLGQDPKNATGCAQKANADGEPFRVRYDLMGVDSSVAGAIVRTPSGKVVALSFDGDPSGGGGTSLFRQRVSLRPCPEPVHLSVNPSGRVNCFTQSSVPPHDIMSPNLEPY
jgi:hypothetical protein